MAKKKLTIEDVLVPKEEIPYEVPENWCWVKLKDISSIISKGTTPKGGKSAYTDSGVKFLRVENIDNFGYIDSENIKYVDEDIHLGFLKRSILFENDILISIAGTLGKTAIVREEDLPLNTNQAIAFIRLKGVEKIIPKYIMLFLSSPEVFKNLISQTKVTAIPNLTLEIIGNCKIPIPPLDEQVRIVNRIESLFDKVDKASELVDEVRDGFEKRKTSILEKGFKGEVIGKEYTDLINLGELIIESSSGFACGKQNEISKEDDGAYPHFRPNNVGFYNQFNYDKIVYIPEDKVQKAKRIINKGDIIFNNTNSTELVGRAVVAREDMEYAFSNHLTRIRVDESKVTPEWAAYCINTLWKQGYFARICKQWVGQSGVNQDVLKKEVAIPVPPIEEQRKIVEILDRLLEKEFEIEDCSNIDRSIGVIKKSILAKAFRGELGSNDLDEESIKSLLD